MRINMCAAIIAMQTFFLIGAHVTAQQVLVSYVTHSNANNNDACPGTPMHDNISSRMGIGYVTSNIAPDVKSRTHTLVRDCASDIKSTIYYEVVQEFNTQKFVFSFQTLCGFLAFAIYFSVLGEFSWLLLHGLRIHGKIKKIFASNLNIEIVYVVIGWGKSCFK